MAKQWSVVSQGTGRIAVDHGTFTSFTAYGAMPHPFAPAVLIVEDEILIRMLAAEAFIEAGFIVFEAEHPVHALTLLGNGALVHVLFTDVNMPGQMNGIDLAERLKSQTPGLHIIITSALPLLRPIDHLSAAFLSKPYDPAALSEMARLLVAA
jgi:CheY-like chemotaxis protein